MTDNVRCVTWYPGETAPKDRDFWAYLYDSGIKILRWATPEDCVEQEGYGTPEDFDGAFTEVGDWNETWEPKFWTELDNIPLPPGCLIRSRW